MSEDPREQYCNSRMERVARDLDAAQSRRSLALSSSTIGWWDWNVVDGSLWWSENMFSLCDVIQETWIPDLENGWARHVYAEDRERVMARLRAALEDPMIAYTAAFRIITRADETRVILASGVVARSPSGLPERMVGICHWVPAPMIHELCGVIGSMSESPA